MQSPLRCIVYALRECKRSSKHIIEVTNKARKRCTDTNDVLHKVFPAYEVLCELLLRAFGDPWTLKYRVLAFWLSYHGAEIEKFTIRNTVSDAMLQMFSLVTRMDPAKHIFTPLTPQYYKSVDK